MRVRSAACPEIEFSTHNPANLVVIENRGKTVIMRTAYDNFSPRRKAFLIRQLAAEGYIPDRYETYSEDTGLPPGLIWVVDRSLMVLGTEAKRRSARFMRQLLVGASLLWLFEMAMLLRAR